MHNDPMYITYDYVQNSVWSSDSDLLSPGWFLNEHKITHYLRIRGIGVNFEVSCETGYNFAPQVVISCLLAALRQVDDDFIYTMARKYVETQMAFEVDTLIPKDIGQITEFNHSIDSSNYKLELIVPVYVPYERPEFVVHHDIQADTYTLSLTVDGMTFHYPVPALAWHLDNKEIVETASKILWENAYKTMPLISPALSYMRYSEEILNPGAKKVAKLNGKSASFKGKVAKPEHLEYAGKRDDRVDSLPGIKERVKHPVTGDIMTLERIIISLNDYYDWTREKIADWLETLDIDITFKVKVEENE